jgi:hypothetical protein
MERAGQLENLDPNGSSVRQPLTYYETDPANDGWNQITEAGSIVFKFKITAQGLKFLREAPKLLGAPITRLKTANPPVEINPKILKIVTYDKQAIQKLSEEFARTARAEIEEAFSATGGTNAKSLTSGSFLCGPKLWSLLKPQATRNGLFPGARIISSHMNLMTGETVTRELPEMGISGTDELRLFWQTMRAVFPLGETQTIRQGQAEEALDYPLNSRDNAFPTQLSEGKVMVFVVETEKARFVVVVRGEGGPTFDPVHAVPRLSWIELLDK